MITLGDVFRRYGPAYRARYGDRMLKSHLAAMQAIEQCRTEALGGHVYTCAACATTRYSYHSCRNRHCPTCQQDAAQRWLAQQQTLVVPVPYFLVTFTLPAGVRQIARCHQRVIYRLRFRASAAALRQLAHDARFLGGQIGMLGVLQTWTRDLRYHPHVHYLVPALALAPDGQTWMVSHKPFLVPVAPLAQLFRAKFRAALCQTPLSHEVSAEAWKVAWVVDCRPIGSGQAALKYLAPYIFRVALSNNRIIGMQDEKVTFRYTDGESGCTRRCTLSAEEFMRRFLQHVLPKGFVKVRYYGLFRVGKRQLFRLAQAFLIQTTAAPSAAAEPLSEASPEPDMLRCPSCGHPMQLVQTIAPQSRGPPAAQWRGNER
jgi:Putative transposase/Transposase zinc-binding domain